MPGNVGVPSRSRFRARIAVTLGALLVASAASALTGTGAAHATTGVNDYPYANGAIDAVDRWNFYTRECTSFAAWRINNDAHVSFTNQYGGVTWGNAGNWTSAARATGVPVDGTPTPGSVAVFPPNVGGAGGYGHVAWVVSVGNGMVLVEDYNFADAYDGYTYYNYSQHTVSPAGLSFLHFGGAVGTPGGPETWVNPATSKYLDLDHSNAANGTKIQIFTGNGTNAQWWVRTGYTGGYYKLTSRATGKCVDVRGPSTADGAAVHEWDCYATDSQLWRWEARGKTYGGWPVYQIRNKYSGRCLDVTAFGAADGTPIQQWTCTGGTNQEWY